MKFFHGNSSNTSVIVMRVTVFLSLSLNVKVALRLHIEQIYQNGSNLVVRTFNKQIRHFDFLYNIEAKEA
jgi:hypothetical protein